MSIRIPQGAQIFKCRLYFFIFRFMVFIGSKALVQYCEIHISHYPIIFVCFIGECILLNMNRLIVCTLQSIEYNICASVLNKYVRSREQ
jgi:hypothetical protein